MPSLPANIGTFNVDDHQQRGLSGAYPTWTLDVTFDGISDDATATTPTTLVPETTTYTAVNGRMQITGLPVPLDPDLSPTVTLHMRETIDGVVNEWDMQPPASIASSTVRLATYRVIGPQSLIARAKGAVAASQTYVDQAITNRLAGFSAGSLLDGNDLIPSDYLEGIIDQPLLIPESANGIASSGSVTFDIGYSKQIRLLALRADASSLGSDFSLNATWIKADGTTATTASPLVLTAATELEEQAAISWNIIAGDQVRLDWTTGSQFGGRRVRLHLLGLNNDWPTELAAPGTPTSPTRVSNTFSWTAPAGGVTATKYIVTYGTGGAEAFLGIASGLSIDVTGIGSGIQLNVRAANRSSASAAASTSASTYSYDYAGTSIDTTKLGFTACTDTTDPSGTGFLPGITQNGVLILNSGESSTFSNAAVLNRTWCKSGGSALSIADFDYYVDFAMDTTGEIDFYLRAANTTLGSTDARLTLKAFNTGLRLAERHGGASSDTYLVASSSTVQAWNQGNLAVGTLYTARFNFVGSALKVKVWQQGTTQPTTGGLTSDGWDVSITSSAITAAGNLVRDYIGPSSIGGQRLYREDNVLVA